MDEVTKMKHDDIFIHRQDFNAAWLPYLLILFFFSYAVFFINHLPLSGPPDELAHLSYIADSAQSNWLLPDYKNGKIVGGEELNFLNHPPLYYSIQAVVGKVFNWDPLVDFKNFRYISLLLVSAGFFFILKSALKLGLSNLQIITLALAALSVPNFVFIASSVNNDNLAYFGSALLFFGVVSLHTANNGINRKPVFIIYFALFVIGLAKVNVALFAIIFLFVWTLLSRGIYLRYFFASKNYFLLIGFVGPLVVYYGLTYFEYGKLFPSPRYVYELLTPDSPLTFQQYAEQFLLLLSLRFSGAYGHLSYLVYPNAVVQLFFFLLLAPFIGYPIFRAIAFFQRKHNPVFCVFDALYVAAFFLLAIHLRLGYEGYLATSRLAAIQPRYYLFLIPLIWLPIFYFFEILNFKKFLNYFFPLIVFILSPIVLAYSSANLLQAKDASPNVLLDHSALNNNFRFSGDFPLSNNKLGHIDLLDINGKYLRVVGWAFDYNNQRPPVSILIFRNKLLISEMSPNAVRPDVMRFVKSFQAMKAGFRLSIPVSASSKVCEFDVLIEFENGIYSRIHHSTC